MKSLWKTIAFTLALLMLFSCAACGSGAKKAEEEEDYEPVEDEYVDEDEYVEGEYQEPEDAEPAVLPFPALGPPAITALWPIHI